MNQDLANGQARDPQRFQASGVNPNEGAVGKKKERKRRKKKVTANREADVVDDQSSPNSNSKTRRAAKRKQQLLQQHINPDADSRNDVDSGSSAGSTRSSRRSESPLQEPDLDIVQKLWLEVNHLSCLKKRYSKHPNALYVCKLCHYYCMNLEHCGNHIKDQKHLRNALEEGKTSTLMNLPAPTKHHSDAVTDLLIETAKLHGISNEMKAERRRVAENVNHLFSRKLRCCQAKLYGSSLTGFGVKSSNINLDFVVAEDSPDSPPKNLKNAYNLLLNSSIVTNVMSDFYSEIPSVLFQDLSQRYDCILSLNSHKACRTSELLAAYDKLDSRLAVLSPCFRFWSKICKIDDHMMGTLPSYSYNILLVYFLQQVEPPVLPVLDDTKVESGDFYQQLIQSGFEWKSSNDMSVGELWIRLFRFYAIEHPATDNVISIRSKAPLKRGDKHWTGRKMAIEDPFHQKRNVSRYIVNHASHEYIMECLKNTYRYFGIPQTDVGPLFALIKKPMEEYIQIPDVERNILAAERSLSEIMDNDHRFMKITDNRAGHGAGLNMISVSELEEQLRGASLNNKAPQGSSEKGPENFFGGANQQVTPKGGRPGQYAQLVVSPKLANALCSRLKREYHMFKMITKMFTLGMAVPVVCSICQQQGHTKIKCPDNYLPPLLPLPPMQAPYMRQLDLVCKYVFEFCLPSKEEIDDRQAIVNDLQAYLRRKYKNAKLDLFGSSCNGFGFHKSDLDICLTFVGEKMPDKETNVAIIEQLVHELKAYGKMTNLISITTAKVPIVKFTYPRSKLDGDISLYNILAQRNTRMLKAYADIDERSKILGYVLKRFAKLCEICDASRGSLSSYAYILMLIYFLQQCNPPVLPVLQQLHPPDSEPENIVEGWNTWFYDDIANIKNVWSDYGKNTSSVGELWLQLLRFYTEDFDFNEHVVSIRQQEKLVRFDKLWNSKCIAIEDPFDTSHNLGSGLSRKMNNFIIKAFRRGRMHFGTPVGYRLVKELQIYLFNPQALTDGQPPNDRGCRICKKIGHICKECPQRRTTKKRSDKKGSNHEKGAAGGQRDSQHRDREGADGNRGSHQVQQQRFNAPNAGWKGRNKDQQQIASPPQAFRPPSLPPFRTQQHQQPQLNGPHSQSPPSQQARHPMSGPGHPVPFIKNWFGGAGDAPMLPSSSSNTTPRGTLPSPLTANSMPDKHPQMNTIIEANAKPIPQDHVVSNMGSTIVVPPIPNKNWLPSSGRPLPDPPRVVPLPPVSHERPLEPPQMGKAIPTKDYQKIGQPLFNNHMGTSPILTPPSIQAIYRPTPANLDKRSPMQAINSLEPIKCPPLKTVGPPPGFENANALSYQGESPYSGASMLTFGSIEGGERVPGEIERGIKASPPSMQKPDVTPSPSSPQNMMAFPPTTAPHLMWPGFAGFPNGLRPPTPSVSAFALKDATSTNDVKKQGPMVVPPQQHYPPSPQQQQLQPQQQQIQNPFPCHQRSAPPLPNYGVVRGNPLPNSPQFSNFSPFLPHQLPQHAQSPPSMHLHYPQNPNTSPQRSHFLNSPVPSPASSPQHSQLVAPSVGGHPPSFLCNPPAVQSGPVPIHQMMSPSLAQPLLRDQQQPQQQQPSQLNAAFLHKPNFPPNQAWESR